METAGIMKTHNVKSWSENFLPFTTGMKTFDLRKDDRGYEVGDLIVFEEFRPGVGEYTGKSETREITYIMRNIDGLEPDYCILGLEE
jgi:hypothetical protein